jgi:NAD(P)H-dependent flavin oxidoreductase YrpB (nitropropane dioxygenase family)
VEGELRTRKHAIEGEVSVVMAGGCSSSFYSGRGGGGHTGVGEGETAGLMALMPLMAGRLDEWLMSEIKEGNQGVE